MCAEHYLKAMLKKLKANELFPLQCNLSLYGQIEKTPFACLPLHLLLIDLARAKSEALDNIYILLKQNIKSCNAKRRMQRRRTLKNNNRSN